MLQAFLFVAQPRIKLVKLEVNLFVTGIPFEGLFENLKRALIIPGTRVAFPQEPVSSRQLGIDGKRLFQARYSLQVFFVSDKDVSQVIIGQRLVGVLGQRQFELLLGFLEVFAPPVDLAHGKVDSREIGVFAKSFFEFHNGLIEALAIGQGLGPHGMGEF